MRHPGDGERKLGRLHRVSRVRHNLHAVVQQRLQHLRRIPNVLAGIYGHGQLHPERVPASGDCQRGVGRLRRHGGPRYNVHAAVQRRLQRQCRSAEVLPWIHLYVHLYSECVPAPGDRQRGVGRDRLRHYRGPRHNLHAEVQPRLQRNHRSADMLAGLHFYVHLHPERVPASGGCQRGVGRERVHRERRSKRSYVRSSVRRGLPDTFRTTGL